MIGKAEARRLHGKDEKESMRILKELYNDPDKADCYIYIHELDKLKKSLQGDKTLILSADSPIVQMINQQNR